MVPAYLTRTSIFLRKLSVSMAVPDFYYAVLNNNNPDPSTLAAQAHGWVISGRMFGSYNFTKTWKSARFFSFYRGRQVTLQGYQGGFRYLQPELEERFRQQERKRRLRCRELLQRQRVEDQESNRFLRSSHRTAQNVMHNLSFKVNFSFRFGKMSFDQQPRRGRRSISNDDLKATVVAIAVVVWIMVVARWWWL